MAEERFELKPVNDRAALSMMIAWPCIAALGFLVVSIENMHVAIWPVPVSALACVGAGFLILWARRRGRAVTLVVDGDELVLRAGRDVWRGSRSQLKGFTGHVVLGGKFQGVKFPAIGFSVGDRTLVVQGTSALTTAPRGRLVVGQRFLVPDDRFARLQDVLRLRA